MDRSLWQKHHGWSPGKKGRYGTPQRCHPQTLMYMYLLLQQESEYSSNREKLQQPGDHRAGLGQF